MLYTDFIFMLEEEYSQTSSNGHLSTMATSPQWPPLYNGHFFLQTVHTLTLVMATFCCPQCGRCREVQL